MKKHYKKLSLLIVAIMMVAAILSACGGGGNGGNGGGGATEAATTEAPKNDDPTGNYVAEYNVKDLLNAQMESAGIELTSDIITTFKLELTADGKYILEMDKDAFAESMVEAMKKDGAGMFKKMFESQGLSDEDIDAALQQAGYGSFDEMIDEYSEQMSDQMKEEMGELKVEGDYQIDGNKITLKGMSGSNDQEGTINDDGSISVKGEMGEMGELDLVFKK